MKIHIKIHPNSSSEERVKEIEKNKEYEVWMKEKPIDGKANEQLIRMLKKYFGKEIRITSGFSSRIKIVDMI
jgi:uncharacterized protein (TIGR00251 family)